MEPQITNPQPNVDPAPPTTAATLTAKKPPQLLYLLLGLAVILITLALGITFFGKKSPSSPTSGGNSPGATQTDAAGSKYTNSVYFYELTLPPKWVEIKHSPLYPNIALFAGGDVAILEITAVKNTSTLNDYLTSQDETNQATIKSTKSTQVKVGQYDGYERSESWPVVGLQAITTYIKISDMLYTFTLIPSGGKSAVTNDSVIRDYHTALAGFRLTDTSQLGLDLKEYVSQSISGLLFKAFSLKYPQTWTLTDKVGENSLDVSIYRNNYELTISQKAVGGAVCLFKDSPDFQGSSGDLRNKDFFAFSSQSGYIFRRYFNQNQGDKSTFFFCYQTSDSAPEFQTPTPFGGIVYYVPAKYDADIIKEMDEIVKSITPLDSPPPSP